MWPLAQHVSIISYLRSMGFNSLSISREATSKHVPFFFSLKYYEIFTYFFSFLPAFQLLLNHTSWLTIPAASSNQAFVFRAFLTLIHRARKALDCHAHTPETRHFWTFLLACVQTPLLPSPTATSCETIVKNSPLASKQWKYLQLHGY